MDGNQVFKVILVGDSSVGKTSLINRYVLNRFEKEYKATIGCDFLAKAIALDGVEYSLQIWDTAGNERYNSVVNSFYRGSDGVVVVFDVTNQKSFDNVDYWLRQFREGVSNDDVPVILAGNKVDVDTARPDSDLRRVVTAAQAASKIGYATYIETSAKTSQSVEELFRELLRLMIQKRGNEGSIGESAPLD